MKRVQIRFQSSLPRGERPAVPDDYPQYCVFQSSLPRGERLVEIEFVPVHLEFQSSLPRGERRCKGGSLDSDSRYFNPRSHEGSDYEGKWYWYSVVYISILAPTRGATLRQICVWLVLLFQSSLPRGERPSIFDTSEEIKEFQSSLPRGERLCLSALPIG